MFIQTEDTPNPQTMKFLPSQEVLGGTKTMEFLSEESAHAVSPLAMALFGIDGIQSVFLGPDFISVTRTPEEEWKTLRPLVLQTIMGHYLSGYPILLSHAPENTESETDTDTTRQIKKILNERIRPAVAQDGGDVTYENFEDGIVYLRLRGACAGCPSATATLKMGIERILKELVPEVKEVRRV